MWDQANERFVKIGVSELHLEHSLDSISKWEGKWKKPFFSREEKTAEETLDYIKCMTLDENVNDAVYQLLTPEMGEAIGSYISDPMTATTFTDRQTHRSREIVTAEIIYFNMVAYNIPPEYAFWHINKLLALIRVCSIKNGGEKKMSSAEAARYQRDLNEKRLAAMAKRRKK